MFRIRLFFYLIIIIYSLNSVYSQSQFKFDDEEKRAVTLKFRSVNNLIILSATLNGELVNFLVDTGVNKTKIFGEIRDSTALEDAEYLLLRSLGSVEPVKAYKTTNNVIDFGPISGENQEVYFIVDPRFDLAKKIGVNVQGIIGYEFFKNFIVRLNYHRKSLRVYQNEKFNRKLRRFDEVDFRFIRKKPHLKFPVELKEGKKEELVFLIDTGSSDAFWIFENDEISAPENSFVDYIGYGLELAVIGKRSKSKSAQLGSYTLDEPRVAYLDSESAEQFTADRFKNGIVGSEILRRFVWFFDYGKQKTYLKPSRYYNDNSNYDRSGLILMYVGEEINTVKTPVLVKINEDNNYGTSQSERFEIRLERSQILQVVQIRKNSPASEVDIRKGDRILKLNGKSVDRLDLQDINDLLSGEEGKQIKIQLKRDKVILKRSLYLKSQLN